MRKLKQAAALLLTAALLSAAMAPAALADSRKKVGKINLTIDTDIRVGSSGGDVEVTATGDNTDLYYIDGCEVVNDYGDEWTRSTPPEFEITLGVEDEDEYYFSGTSSSNFKLTMGSSIKNRYDKLKFVDAKKKDGGATMVLTVQLIFDKDADMSSANPPSDATWAADQTAHGSWSGSSDSKYYQLQLIRDNSEIGEIFSVYDTSYDFSKLITQPGAYRFKVRSVRSSNSAKSSWVTSDTWNVTEAEITAPAESAADETAATQNTTAPEGSWTQTADGTRWQWKNPDGTFAASQWLSINGSWYYFDAQGYMATGWVEVNGLQYYLDPDTGAMYANCRTPDGYWVNESGAWVPGP